MVVSAEDPELGPIKMQGNPIKLSAYDDPPSRAPAPDLDANPGEPRSSAGLVFRRPRPRRKPRQPTRNIGLEVRELVAK